MLGEKGGDSYEKSSKKTKIFAAGIFALLFIVTLMPTISTNQPPVADAGSDQQVTDYDGNGEETVTLDGTGSYDPDPNGSIIYYEWREGTTILGNTAIINTSLNIGTHIVNLTVMDDDHAADYDIVIITIEAGTIHVENIDMDKEKSGPNYRAIATVLIYDQSSNAKQGATVTGDWYFKGDLIQTGASGVTDQTGNAVIHSPWTKAKKGDTFTFVVTNVELDQYIYDEAANVETEDSITA